MGRGIVYTNVKSLEVKKETYNPNIIKSILVKQKAIYEPLKLKSYYRNRIDYGDITPSFYGVLDKVFCTYFGIEIDRCEFFDENKNKVRQKIDIEGLDAQDEIILNKQIDTELFDQLPDEVIKGEKANLFSDATLMKANLSQDDLFHIFEYLIKINLSGFAYKRSIPTVKQALYRWFKKYLDVKLVGNGIIYIQNVVLNNAAIFSTLFDESIRKYKPLKDTEINKKIEEIEEWNVDWEIASSRNFNPHTYDLYTYALSLYDPCYLKIDSAIEKEFIEYLEEKRDVVKWWWQNGDEHMALNFGIKYGSKSTFQPDFLVLFVDGRLVLCHD